jgi:hypothetical protein
MATTCNADTQSTQFAKSTSPEVELSSNGDSCAAGSVVVEVEIAALASPELGFPLDDRWHPVPTVIQTAHGKARQALVREVAEGIELSAIRGPPAGKAGNRLDLTILVEAHVAACQ